MLHINAGKLIGLSVLVGYAFLGAQAASAQDNPREEVLADFESGTYQGWALQGNCFGSGPASANLFPGQIEGYGGSHFACTLDPRLGTAARGVAVSPDFIIDRPVLRFRIGGGHYPHEACLNLVVNGKIVCSETGNGCAALYPESWDVSALEGKTAHLEILDATSAFDRGYIMVDDIVLGYPAQRPTQTPSPTLGVAARSSTEQNARLGSPVVLKALAALNSARLSAHLPLLALDGALEAAAQKTVDANCAYQSVPTLPVGCRSESLDTADNSALSSRLLLDAQYKTVGLALAAGTASGSGQQHDWTVVYSQREPGQGDVVAVADPSFQDAPIPQNTLQIAPMPISRYSLRSISANVSGYSNIPVLPGFGGPSVPNPQPTFRPTVPADAPTVSSCGLSVFPVLDGANWNDTFGAPRVGHTHQGEDLMAPKMRPLVACFSGVVTLKLADSPQSTAGNMIHLTAANGWTAIYMHINCDTPGTMDGKGGARYAFAAGLKSGDHVHVGQILGYTGDSGNARGGAAHCHFELHPPSAAAINPTVILRAARILHSPEAPTPTPAEPIVGLPALAVPVAEAPALSESTTLPGVGEIAIEGTLSAITPGSLVLIADSVTLPEGSPTRLSQPRVKNVCWSSALPIPATMTSGNRVTVVGQDSGPGTVLRASLLAFRL